MKKNFKFNLISLLFISLLTIGCSNEDDGGTLIDSDPFYGGAKTNAEVSLLYKYWSIYEVNFESRTAQVPHNYTNCDRDFFTFQINGNYQEFIIPDSGCIPNQQSLNWSYNNGVITLRNAFNDSIEMVIVELSEQQFVFRAKLDFDEDGEEDILQFLARPYTPDEGKFYQNTIQLDEPVTNQIRLTWSEYEGIGSFDRYEILLSTENCNINNATLLATITDKEVTFFEDDNPPQAEQLCYFLKLYTSDGILFQSNAASISTDLLEVPGTALKTPEISNNSITLDWGKYEGLYFSHYELVVKNYFDGFASEFQEEVIAEITDIDQTTFIDNNPPLVKNPVYEIRVYNVFGKQNFYNPQVVQTAQEASFIPEGIIDILSIDDLVYDQEEPIIYLYGSVENTQEKRLLRYNYSTLQLEAISNRILNYGSDKGMKLIEYNGLKEILFLGNNELLVFNAETLEYKYDLENNQVNFIDDFLFLGGSILALINEGQVYTLSRDFANTTLIDTQVSFESSQNTNNYLYHALEISNNRILTGNANESKSIAFTYDDQGNLSNREVINIPILSTYSKETLYNKTDNTIINMIENRIYSLENNSIQSFEQPFFPRALILEGTQIIGSNNDPEWFVDDGSLHEKATRTYNVTTNIVEVLETKGYPHFYFESASGEVFALSTYFKRSKPSTSYEKSDFFIEKIN